MTAKMVQMFNDTWEYKKGVGKKKLNSTEKRLREICASIKIRMPINLDETFEGQ